MRKLTTLLFLVFGTAFLIQAQINTFPYNQDFETLSQGPIGCGNVQVLSIDWTNSTNDDIDWVSDVNGTGSSNTGPTANGGADHKPGVSGGVYLYTEASGCVFDTAMLISPMVQTDPNAPNLFFNFWYHEYGIEINVLYVDTRLVVGGIPGAWSPLDTLMDPSLDQWRETQYDFSSFVGDTFQVRLRGVTGSSYHSDIAIDDISFFSLFQNDAGVTAIDGPTNPVSVGMNNVDVSIQNFGADTLMNVSIGWSVNGMVQTPFSWTGSLANSQSAGPITIGSYNFPPGISEICAWTSMPNMMADSSTGNDTTCFSVCTPLSGVYTLGGPGADFADFTEAGSLLSSCGIDSHVVINVNPGVYMENLILDHVPGTDTGATITIDGQDTTMARLVGSNAATIFLDGTDYTTIQNLTIEATGTNDAYGVQLRDTASNNVIDACHIIMSSAANTSDCIGVSASNSQTSSYSEGQNAFWTTVSNCHISGGEMGIHFEGRSTGRNIGNSFTNNWLDSPEDYGLYFDDQDSLLIFGNRITDLRGLFADAIRCSDLQMFDISENVAMDVPDQGIIIFDGNFNLDGTPTSRGRIINNMVSSNNGNAALFDDFELTDVWHNTFVNASTNNGAIRLNDFVNLDIRNNIFANLGSDFAFESDDPMANTTNVLNYNNYYVTAASSNLVDDGFATYVNLAAWLTGSPTYNANSVSGDPVFLSGLLDLHVKAPVVNDVGDNSVGILIDVDGDARPATPSTIVDMGADEFTPIANDAVAVDWFGLGSGCGDSMTMASVIIQNLGTTTITSLPITVNITGGITATLTTTYTGSLAFNEKDTVLVGTFNSYLGGAVSLDGYVSLVGDSLASNDTFPTCTPTYTSVPPQGITGVGCGVDSAYIYGANFPGVSYAWFANTTDTIPISQGDSFLVPSIMAQSTYYMEYINSFDSLATPFNNNNGSGGNMFDVVATNSVTITSLAGNFNTGNATVEIYWRDNATSWVGNENSSAGWTLLGTATNFPTNGPGSLTPVPVNFAANLQAGNTYGFYMAQTAGPGVNYTNGTSVGNVLASNSDISILEGCGKSSGPAFVGSTFQPRLWNGVLYYGFSGCSNIRTPVSAITTPQPSVNLGNDTTLCGTSLALDAGNPGFNYSWSNGATTQTTNATMSGPISVVVSDTIGCDDSDTIDVTINPVPVVNLGADLLLCDGATDTLDAGNPGATYAWSTAGTGQLEVVSMAGTVTVTVTDTNMCAGTDTVIVTTGMTPASAYTFTVGGAGLAYTFTDGSTGTPTSWSWNFGDGNTSTVQNPMHTYAAAGSYTVTLTVVNACGTNVSTQSVTVVGVEQALAGGIVSLYPNPNQGLFNLEFNGLQAANVNLRILNVKGQVVLDRRIEEQGSFVQEIDITRFAKGMYLLQLTADGEQILQRVIVD